MIFFNINNPNYNYSLFIRLQLKVKFPSLFNPSSNSVHETKICSLPYSIDENELRVDM
jgi:hypothetical protein